MATKSIWTYIERHIDKESIKEEKDLINLNWNYIMSKAYMEYLKDKGKVEDSKEIKKDKFNNKIRRVRLKW